MPYRVTCTKFNSCVFFCNIFQCHLLVRWRRRWRRNVTCLIFLFLRVFLTQLNLRTALVHKHYNFHWNKQTHTHAPTQQFIWFSLSLARFFCALKNILIMMLWLSIASPEKKTTNVTTISPSLTRSRINLHHFDRLVCVCLVWVLRWNFSNLENCWEPGVAWK